MHTRYESKRHGGFNIYEDDKVRLILDTYVSNVDAYVKLPNDNFERVFSCAYTGGSVTYHKGKWENYLDELYKKAEEAEANIKREYEEKRHREEDTIKAPCSSEADAIFGS